MSSVAIDRDTLNAALTQSLNAFAISSERKAAEAYLQQIKNTDTKEVFILFINYISTSFSCYTSSITESNVQNQLQQEANTQLVFSLLSDWLQTWWNKFTTEDHIYIRTTIIQQLIISASSTITTSITQNQPSQHILLKSKAIRNKIAYILANIAKRQYPQNWSTFITDIVELWTNLSIFEIQEIFINTIDNLLTDCINPDYASAIPSLRKQDILSNFKTDLSILLPVLSNYFKFCLNEYQLLNNTNNANTNITSKKTIVIHTIKSIIQLLITTTTYIRSDEIYNIQSDLFSILLLINNNDFQTSVVELLAVFTSYKIQNFDTFFHILSYICQTPLTFNSTNSYDNLDLSEVLVIQSYYATAILYFLNYNIWFLLTSTYPPKVSIFKMLFYKFDGINILIYCFKCYIIVNINTYSYM